MTSGYAGTILRVDLSSGKIDHEHPTEEFYRTYLGGSALNMYYLLSEMKPDADALDQDNMLCLSVGPATGLAIAGQSRMTVNAKSPLTGAIGDSQTGGYLPAELKSAGFDAVIIKGRSPKPVYLWLHDGQAEIRDAVHLWGRFTGDADRLIKEELEEDRLKTLLIGPGGERLVRYAAMMSSLNRAAGRTGMGAVMGSKNLKAIAVRGTGRPVPADKTAFKSLAAAGAKVFPDSMVAGMQRFGTSTGVDGNQSAGGLPTRNFSSGVFEGWEKISSKSIFNNVLRGAPQGQQMQKGRATCFGCMVRCKPVAEITEGSYRVDPAYGGPEYETLAALGSYCNIDDLAAICKANELCNKYGIDTISCGGTIAWAMEAYEAGVLTDENTGQMAIRFGDAEAMVRLVEMIGKREGIGDLLADGSAAAADRLGKGAAFLVTVKGQEVPAHMSQVKAGLGLIYAVNPFGADHMSCEHDPGYEDAYPYYKERLSYLGFTDPQPKGSLTPEKIRFMWTTQKLASLMDSLCLCQFVWGTSWQLYGPEDLVRLVNAATGWDMGLDELLTVGERRIMMMRVFNERAGIGTGDDQLPKRFFDRPLKNGPTDGMAMNRSVFEAARQEYYRQANLDPRTGRPTQQTIDRLGLKVPMV